MIRLEQIALAYPSRQAKGGLLALADLSLEITAGEFVSIIGPSGCGKTTLLKIVCGLLRPDRGQVLIDGRPVEGPGPDRAMVFQDFALLPWADSLTNAAFGLEMLGVERGERRRRARAWLEAVGLQGFEHQHPHELSGGMQQRVGLARALAVEPRILLMDEPFGAVDSQTRRLLQEDLLRIVARGDRTVVFVTHSMDEAVRMGDRVVLLGPRPGRVIDSIAVPFAKGRGPDMRREPAFIELKEHLWARLRAMQPGIAGEADDGGG